MLRYRADRHPVEHATLQFHLGAALLDGGGSTAAIQAFRTSAMLFEQADRPIELAKARNLLGAALHNEGRIDEAAPALIQAAELFAANDLPTERAAAVFNLGLVRRLAGDLAEAARCFSAARERFHGGELTLQASAAARELGTVLLELGRREEAITTLEEALVLAEQAADRAAVGGAANVLGLAQLEDDPAAAVASFLTAAEARPRPLDPEGYAVASVNLALAYRELGDDVRSRLAARYALRTPGAPDAVLAQANEVLGQLGDPPDDVFRLLDDLPQDRWVEVVRPELVSLVDADATERRRARAAWVAGQAERDGGTELAAADLEVLLELSPAATTTLIRSTVEALQQREPEVRDRYRSQVTRAMARFHLPQWSRLEHLFASLAAELGDGSWQGSS